MELSAVTSQEFGSLGPLLLKKHTEGNDSLGVVCGRRRQDELVEEAGVGIVCVVESFYLVNSCLCSAGLEPERDLNPQGAAMHS